MATHDIAGRALSPQITNIIRRIWGGHKDTFLTVCRGLSCRSISKSLSYVNISNATPGITSILKLVTPTVTRDSIVIQVAKMGFLQIVRIPIYSRFVLIRRIDLIKPSLNSSVDLSLKVINIGIELFNGICKVCRVLIRCVCSSLKFFLSSIILRHSLDNTSCRFANFIAKSSGGIRQLGFTSIVGFHCILNRCNLTRQIVS